jgi:WD40 repeat protein
VRCVCAVDGSVDNDIRVATSSRDQTVKIWSAVSGHLLQTLEGHQHFVGTVISIRTSPYFPSPSIASGGNDKIINVWYFFFSQRTFQPYSRDIQKQSPVLTLIGHSDTVCALSLTSHGELISGSWDK